MGRINYIEQENIAKDYASGMFWKDMMLKYRRSQGYVEDALIRSGVERRGKGNWGTQAERERTINIISLYKSTDINMAEIARRFSVSRQRVEQIIINGCGKNRGGFIDRRYDLSRERIDKVLSLNGTKSLACISEEVNIPAGIVRKILGDKFIKSNHKPERLT